MRRFEKGQRIRLTTPEGDDTDDMVGQHGTVVRLGMADAQAWVNMDGPIADSIRCFSPDDPHGRGNHILLWPDQCEIAEANERV